MKPVPREYRPAMVIRLLCAYTDMPSFWLDFRVTPVYCAFMPKRTRVTTQEMPSETDSAVQTSSQNTAPQMGIFGEIQSETSSSDVFPKKEKVSAERLSMYTTENGVLDISRFKSTNSEDKAKDVLKRSMDSEEFRKWLGVGGQNSSQEMDVSPQIVGYAFDSMAHFQALIESKRLKVPLDECKRFISFKSEQHALLDPMGASVANKYIPLAWRQKMDLMLFCGMIMSMVSENHLALAAYAREKYRGREKETVADRQTAAPVPEPPVEATN